MPPVPPSGAWKRLEELAQEHDPAQARALLEAWRAPSAAQAAVRDEIVAWIARYPRDIHLRTRLEGHLTASALVVDASGGRALLTHHRKLGRWLQLGGHCDGDANLARVALREAIEESGISDLAVDPVPIDVDVHPIPARAGEPEHLHLDVRFLVVAPHGARAERTRESVELGWFLPADGPRLGLDSSVQRLLARLPLAPGRPASSGTAQPGPL
jgi:8-oxo-dGTP pyrophosphatase MutT (NUDIX family)